MESPSLQLVTVLYSILIQLSLIVIVFIIPEQLSMSHRVRTTKPSCPHPLEKAVPVGSPNVPYGIQTAVSLFCRQTTFMHGLDEYYFGSSHHISSR